MRLERWNEKAGHADEIRHAHRLDCPKTMSMRDEMVVDTLGQRVAFGAC